MLYISPLTISCVLALVAYIYNMCRKNHLLPPGPRGLPIVGSLFDMPKAEEWLHWSKFKDLYGPISSVQVFNKTIIILNNLDISQELLHRRSQIYSSRPVLPFAGEMIGWDRQLILSSDGERHRAMRKMVAQFIGTRAAVAALSETQETESRLFTLAVVEQPGDILVHIRRAASAMLLKTVHGYSIERKKPDPLITIIETAAREFYIAAAPGRWLVDSLPLLKYVPDWMPGAGFKQVAAKFRETNFKQVFLPINMVKQKMVLEGAMSPMEEEVFPFVATSLYGGGQDTISATLGTFFLAMILYPNVQYKAQKELDDVLSGCFFPKVETIDKLPYLQAVYKEVTRWHTALCINGPHSTTQDDWYDGYYIPKGSVVISNLWQIANDTCNYTNPSKFDPERFLGDNPELDPLAFVFGFGKRRCPGIELARVVCILMMATTLVAFNISNAKDEHGQPIAPAKEFFSGTVCHPKPFPYEIHPRSEEAKELIDSVKHYAGYNI